MLRSYQVRGKRVTVDELAGVVAAKFSDSEAARRAEAAGSISVWQGTALEPATEPELTLAEREALRQGAWVLMRPVPGSAPTADESRSEPIAIGQVYRSESGELMINTGRLTVRLREELSNDEAEAALARHDLAVKRRLGFAPNLFEVEASGSRGAIEVAELAIDDDDYQYAEPQMIRKLGHR